jgi:multidrug efflux pump subunit AcrA (membrane-fusion protein)/DNA-binding NarL/FixJ family response regulator
MIRTLLVDDENLIRKTLQIYLESEPNIEIIATADNGNTAINLVKEFEPDVILLDIEMPEMDGLMATEELSLRFPQSKIIILSSHDEPEYLNRALTAGAKGYLLKNISPEELSQSIELVNQGYLQVAPGLDRKLSLTAKFEHTTVVKTAISETLSQENLAIAKSNQDNSLQLSYDYHSLPQDAELTSIEVDEFLPPVSRWTSRGALILLGIFGMAVCLANVLQYKTTIKAAAKVRPAGETRLVQATTEGTITSIRVEANQAVQQGDIIATIDPTKIQIQQQQLKQKLKQEKEQLIQIKAQIIDQDNQIDAEKVVLKQQLEIAQAELESANVAVEIAKEEFARYKQLGQTGAVSQLQISKQRAILQEAIGRQKQAQAAIAPSNTIIKGTEQNVEQQASGQAKISSLNRDRKTLIEKQINLTGQIENDDSALQQVENDLDKTTIRASASGIVQQLNLRNQEQIVKLGEILATITPNNSKLVITAEVATEDISKLKTGQDVQLKISACPYPDYGILRGTVKAISPDVVEASSQNQNSYQITIEPQNNFLGTSKRKCFIQVGMNGSADILTEKETVIGFLLRKARLKTGI